MARSRFVREKLPEIALESFFILLAVFCALAVDQWRERRSQSAQARLARNRIESELRSNIDELELRIPEHEAALKSLDEALETLEVGGEVSEVYTELSVATLSDSAWDTAKATNVLNYMDFDWVLKVTEAYELQDLCQESQSEALKYMSSLGDDSDRQPEDVLGGIRGRIDVVLKIQQGLLSTSQAALGADAAAGQ